MPFPVAAYETVPWNAAAGVPYMFYWLRGQKRLVVETKVLIRSERRVVLALVVAIGIFSRTRTRTDETPKGRNFLLAMFRLKKKKAHFSKPDLTGEKAPRLMEVMEASQATAVAQVQAGDHAAFQSLVEKHSLSLFRVAFRMTGSETDAEEIVQDTFLRAYQQRKFFEARSNVGTWLYRIAVNGSIDLLRKRKRHDAHLEPLDSDEPSAPVLSLASSSPAADRLVYSAQLGKRVAGVLEQLSSVERAAFILRHYEELSTEEIAESLGLSSNAAKQAVFRAVQKMRKALEPWTRSRQ